MNELKSLENLLFIHNNQTSSNKEDHLSLEISKIEYSGHTSFQNSASDSQQKSFATFSNVTNFFAILSSDSLKKLQKNDKLTTSKNSVLFSCHYDSYYLGPGAHDDSLACALQLELLTVLINNFTFFPDNHKLLEHEIIFGFFGAEEPGSLGSYAFSRDEERRDVEISMPHDFKNIQIWNHDLQEFADYVPKTEKKPKEKPKKQELNEKKEEDKKKKAPEPISPGLANRIGVFINSEFCGFGGPQFLLRATDAWISQQIYDSFKNTARSSPIAQDIFESSLFPSDTDFTQFDGRYWTNQINKTAQLEPFLRKLAENNPKLNVLKQRKSSFFQKLGSFYRKRVKKSPRKNIISGVDIAGIRNGQVYHSRKDDFSRYEIGTLQQWGEDYLSLIMRLSAMERNFPANSVFRFLIEANKTANKIQEEEDKPFFSETIQYFLSKLGLNSTILGGAKRLRSEMLGFIGTVYRIVAPTKFKEIAAYSTLGVFISIFNILTFNYQLDSLLKFNNLFSILCSILFVLSLFSWYFEYIKYHGPIKPQKRASFILNAILSFFVNFMVVFSFFFGGIMLPFLESLLTTRIFGKLFNFYSFAPIPILTGFWGLTSIFGGFLTVTIVVEYIFPVIFDKRTISRLLSIRTLLIIQFMILQILLIVSSWFSLQSSIIFSICAIWYTIFYVSVYDATFSYMTRKIRSISLFLGSVVPAVVIYEQIHFISTVFQPIFGRIDFTNVKHENLEIPDLIFRLIVSFMWIFAFSFLIPGFYDIAKVNSTKNEEKQKNSKKNEKTEERLIYCQTELSWSKRSLLAIFGTLLAVYSFILAQNPYSESSPKRLIIQNVISSNLNGRSSISNYVSLAGLDPLGLNYILKDFENQPEISEKLKEIQFRNTTTFYSVQSSAVPNVLAEKGQFGTFSFIFDEKPEFFDDYGVKNGDLNVFKNPNDSQTTVHFTGKGSPKSMQMQVIIESQFPISDFCVFGTKIQENLKNPIEKNENSKIYSHLFFSHDKLLDFKISSPRIEGITIKIVSIFANDSPYSSEFSKFLSVFEKRDWMDVSESVAFVQEIKL